ncbi:MAG: thioredoxin [Geminicoccaceae bacterium]
MIKEGSTRTFAVDVLDASRTTPVLVDFWAPWCGPCKQLTPILEKVVKGAGGKVKLVKINIDESPELAGQMGVRSVPTVFAFVGGQPVTGFQGAQPESQIKALVDQLAGGSAENGEGALSLDDAKAAVAAGDMETAARIYQELLAAEESVPEAIGGLARCLVALGQAADAKALLQGVGDEHAKHPDIVGAQAAVKLAEEAGEIGDPQALIRRVDQEPDDHEARYQLATASFLQGQLDAAIDHLIAIVKRDRDWNEDGARKRLLEFFEALGANHPATVAGRRKLSQVLFS